MCFTPQNIVPRQNRFYSGLSQNTPKIKTFFGHASGWCSLQIILVAVKLAGVIVLLDKTGSFSSIHSKSTESHLVQFLVCNEVINDVK